MKASKILRYFTEGKISITCSLFLIAGKLHIVTEFCSGGSLRNLLLKSRITTTENSPNYMNMASTLNHRELLKLAVDVASGMAHLSSQKVCVIVFFLPHTPLAIKSTSFIFFIFYSWCTVIWPPEIFYLVRTIRRKYLILVWQEILERLRNICETIT